MDVLRAVVSIKISNHPQTGTRQVERKWELKGTKTQEEEIIMQK